MIHLGKAIYSCRLCDGKEYTNFGSVVVHASRMHQKPFKVAIIDKSASYEGEIKAMLDQCFGEPEKKPLHVGSTKTKTGEGKDGVGIMENGGGETKEG